MAVHEVRGAMSYVVVSEEDVDLEALIASGRTTPKRAAVATGLLPKMPQHLRQDGLVLGGTDYNRKWTAFWFLNVREAVEVCAHHVSLGLPELTAPQSSVAVDALTWLREAVLESDEPTFSEDAIAKYAPVFR